MVLSAATMQSVVTSNAACLGIWVKQRGGRNPEPIVLHSSSGESSVSTDGDSSLSSSEDSDSSTAAEAGQRR